MHRSASSPVASVFRFRPLAGALVLALVVPASVAATLGHSHLVSVLGQPLQINVQLNALTADDLRSLKARPAPAQAWVQSGLTPPVDLSSLRFQVVDGYAAGSKVIQVRSDQAFDQPVADLLLDVNTAAGQQRFQVSLLTQGGSQGAAAGPGVTGRGESSTLPARAASADRRVSVKWGDTMFSIANRHAVPGVSVYQMMIALHRANPQAFIDGNLNLVRAGATLRMPGVEALTAISDREARRLFIKQAQAFALYRQRAAADASAADGVSASSGAVTTGGGDAPVQPDGEGPRDQLRLSGGANGSGDGASTRADDTLAARKGIEDSTERVSQLEANVRDLNEALQAQGDAAGNLVLEGARSLTDSLSAAPDAQGDDEAGQAGGDAPAGQASGPTGQGAEDGAPGKGGNTAGDAANDSSPGAGVSDGAEQGESDRALAEDANAHGAGAASAEADGSATGVATVGPGATGSDPAGDVTGSATSGAGASSSGTTDSGTTGSSTTAGDASGAADTAGAAGAGADSSPSQGGEPDTAGQGDADGTSAAAGAADDSDFDSTSSKADTSVSWLQEHMLGVITGVLALIVLIIAWLLRRANSARSDASDGVITEAMVQEKLNQIDLEFTEPPAGGPRSPDR